MVNITTTVIQYNNELKGCVSINRLIVPVNQTIVSEKVLIDIQNKGPQTTTKLLKIIEKSPLRVNPPCNIYDKCGGCSLQHIKYQEQLNIKHQYVVSLFKNAFNHEYEVKPTIGMENPSHYRNKNQIVFQNSRGGQSRIVSGFYQEGTHNIVDFNKCYIQDEVSDKIVESIKDMMLKMRLTAYDEDRKTGLIRHVLIKRSAITKEVMVVLVIATDNFPGRSNFIKAITARHPEITTIIQNINTRSTSAVLGDKETILYGKGFINDVLLNKKFKISSKSFYQINAIQTAKLYQTALEKAELSKNDCLLDAYCGVGTIGIIASDYVSKVIGVEIVKDAIDDAITNAKINNIKNIRFFCDDASNFMVNLANKKEKIDVVIMDPPRRGADQKFLLALIKLHPTKIIYISCNPETQVDDLQLLLKNNYQITYIQPVDMFPHTSAVENITILKQK